MELSRTIHNLVSGRPDKAIEDPFSTLCLPRLCCFIFSTACSQLNQRRYEPHFGGGGGG